MISLADFSFLQWPDTDGWATGRAFCTQKATQTIHKGSLLADLAQCGITPEKN